MNLETTAYSQEVHQFCDGSIRKWLDERERRKINIFEQNGRMSSSMSSMRELERERERERERKRERERREREYMKASLICFLSD